MDKVSETSKENFFYPIAPYHDTLNNDKVLFNTNLQIFAHQVGFIANLQTSGKISSQEAYSQIESLWNDLDITINTIIGDG